MTKKDCKHIYIFGAHSRGKTLGVYLQKLYPNIVIDGYLVDNDEDNVTHVDGVPVINLNDKGRIDTNNIVYIGTRGIYHDGIVARLKKLGVNGIIPVTPELDMELRNKFVGRYFMECGREFSKIGGIVEDISKCCIYVAKSINDTPLKHEPELTQWEKRIQVGCSLSDQAMEDCTFRDNVGENISLRNRQFCELTALFWIWKNARETVIGLEHYRRRFLLSDDWMVEMDERKIDVILPVPLYVYPSLADNYRDRHFDFVWEVMMGVLQSSPKQYIEAVDFFEKNGCYSPCNMLVARRDVLDDLCKWLFPILFQVTGQIGDLKDDYQNRYPGFLSERLISFFFYRYRNRYKVTYADKSFLA